MPIWCHSNLTLFLIHDDMFVFLILHKVPFPVTGETWAAGSGHSLNCPGQKDILYSLPPPPPAMQRKLQLASLGNYWDGGWGWDVKMTVGTVFLSSFLNWQCRELFHCFSPPHQLFLLCCRFVNGGEHKRVSYKPSCLLPLLFLPFRLPLAL